MKITVTKPELLAILTAHFHQEVTECTISKLVGPTKLEVAMAKELHLSEITQSNISGERKIPAIKALRTIVTECNLGLSESKWAVENWEKWITFYRIKGRVPRFEGDIWATNPKLI